MANTQLENIIKPLIDILHDGSRIAELEKGDSINNQTVPEILRISALQQQAAGVPHDSSQVLVVRGHAVVIDPLYSVVSIMPETSASRAGKIRIKPHGNESDRCAELHPGERTLDVMEKVKVRRMEAIEAYNSQETSHADGEQTRRSSGRKAKAR